MISLKRLVRWVVILIVVVIKDVVKKYDPDVLPLGKRKSSDSVA